MKPIKLKVWGLISLNKKQILILELCSLTFFIILTIFLFTYDFKPHLGEVSYNFHAKYAKYFSLVCTFLIIIEAQFLWSQFTKNQLDIIEEQKKELDTQNLKIQESINYASKIQQVLLPSESKLQRLLKEHFVLYLPRDIVSGDYYWVEEFNDQVVVAVADCTGHGVPGAFLSAMGISLLNEIVLTSKAYSYELTPSFILKTLNKRIRNIVETSENEEDIYDGMDISVCIIDKKHKQFSYSGALLSMIHVSNLKNEQTKPKIEQLKPDLYPIVMGGMFSKENNYKHHTISYEENDMLYLYSDGYKDQFGGGKKQKFMNKNFLKLIGKISNKPLDIQYKEFSTTLNEWKGDYEQIDDITVMGIRL